MGCKLVPPVAAGFVVACLAVKPSDMSLCTVFVLQSDLWEGAVVFW
jgi:hypothetical protein